ncbi:MAG: methyltransferase, FkbM family domain protein [Betaproteobacteria bacterium]|nr:methyltransferase, FkbM family domain protein [Betaproteobacteria bacterium]
MGIGAQSPAWRRLLLRTFGSTYFRRKVCFEGGAFEAYLSPGSSLKFLRLSGARVDQVHQRFISSWIKPDSVVWDIGMNVGMFAFPAAVRAAQGHVYGFEADVELAANLLRSQRLPLNRSLHLSVFCIALSDADSTANFEISRYSRAMNKLQGVGEWHQSAVAVKELRSVATMRIDTLAQSLPPPDVIKIDVEGAEARVLEGGAATIARHRPIMLVEGPRELWEQIGAFFSRLDYVMLDGAAEQPVPLQTPVWDTVAVPREKHRP